MLFTLFKLFVFSFLLNLLWELLHSQLYETCLKLPLQKVIPLIIGASLKDGFWITLFFFLSTLLFHNEAIFTNSLQLFVFTGLCLLFSFVDEKLSLKYKRWKYSASMPLVFGVGITPLVELAVTGILSFFFVFWM